MRKTLIVLLALFCNCLYAQTKPDYDALAKVCELWGLIKYFHPNSPGKEFDSAFAANIPKLLEAGSENDVKQFLNQWLGILKDPGTAVADPEDSKSEEEILSAQSDPDSTLIVRISGVNQLKDINRMRNFFNDVERKIALSKKGIIFDLRQPSKISPDLHGYLAGGFAMLDGVLATRKVPQLRKKYYSGFKPEVGYSSGGYTTNWVLEDILPQGTFEDRKQKVVWVVNKNSELPPSALSQQAAGVGVILSNQGSSIHEMLSLSVPFPLSGSITVKFKASELVMPGWNYPAINYTYAATDNPLAKARALLSEKFVFKTERINPADEELSDANTYPGGSYPAIGYRVLAAAKIFTVIEHFFPYYKLMDKDWKKVLRESLPEIVNAGNNIEYGLAVAKMYAHIQDSHGSISGNKGTMQLSGPAYPPFFVEWIENKAVITRFRNDSVCNANKISVGDIITGINDTPVEVLMEKLKPYFAYSTEEGGKQLLAQNATWGPENATGKFTLEDKNGTKRDVYIQYTRTPVRSNARRYALDTIAIIDGNIGYADLTRMEAGRTDEMFEKLKDTRAIIFDMRGYPKGTAWTITPRLGNIKNIPLALVKRPEVLGPNIKNGEALSFRSHSEFQLTIPPSDQWKYNGKTIMLINHKAMSQAEHTGLYFESANNTTFIGSPTAGANGDVTRFQIPGGMTLLFTGQAVMHADGRQLQRVGLQPHVSVKPTVEGIRAGKDEVLEKAIEWVKNNVD